MTLDTGDPLAFERLVAPHRRELLVHAYRLLGSTQDAEDALQDALTAAWRGVAEAQVGRGGARLALSDHHQRRVAHRGRRGPRMLSWELGPAADPRAELGTPREDAGWVEPSAPIRPMSTTPNRSRCVASRSSSPGSRRCSTCRPPSGLC